MKTSQDASVKSAFRALALLDLLAKHPEGVSFSEIQSLTGYPKGSLHSLLATLTACGWARLDTRSKVYSLGFRAWQVGVAYASATSWEDRAREIMGKLRDRLGETVQLAVLDEMQALYIVKMDGLHNLRLDSRVGQKLKLHATAVGKILLAGLPAPAVAEWLKDRSFERYTDRTIVDAHRLVEELELVRERGHATDIEERTLGACCLAVAVRDDTGNTVAALSTSSPSVRFGPERQANALPLLHEASFALSRSIGEDLRTFTS